MEKSEQNLNLKPGLVSVIVPVYNDASCLPKCIQSVMAQSYMLVEVIIVDDGSTDETANMCDRYAERDPSVIVIHQPNKGPAAARNAGLAKAKGEFILFLDSDDSLERTAVDELVNSLREFKADLAISNFSRVLSPSEKKVNLAYPPFYELRRHDLVKYTFSYLQAPNKCPLFGVAWGRLFKSAIIKSNGISFDESLHTFEDVAFLFEYLSHAKNGAYFLADPMYNYMVPYAEQKNYSSACMTIGNNPQRQWGFTKALLQVRGFLTTSMVDAENVEAAIGHGYVALTCIQLVRICGQLYQGNRETIYQFVNQLVNDPTLRRCLRHYDASTGPHKLLPLLIRLKLTRLILRLSQYKAYKKYGKPKVAS